MKHRHREPATTGAPHEGPSIESASSASQQKHTEGHPREAISEARARGRGLIIDACIQGRRGFGWSLIRARDGALLISREPYPTQDDAVESAEYLRSSVYPDADLRLPARYEQGDRPL